MSATAAFTLAFLVTLVLLGAVYYTGFRARRKLHVASVVGMWVALIVTIRKALILGEVYDLEAAGWITPVHLFLARVATVAFVLQTGLGLRTIFIPRTRSTHRKFAYLVLALTLATAATGTAMILASEPIAPGSQ